MKKMLNLEKKTGVRSHSYHATTATTATFPSPQGVHCKEIPLYMCMFLRLVPWGKIK